MPYEDTPEKVVPNPKDLETTFPVYQAEIAKLSPSQKEDLIQASQTYPIIKYLLWGKSFEYDLDGDWIPEKIKGKIPFDQIFNLAMALKEADEQKEKEIIEQTLKAYVELKDLKEDLFLNLQSKEILKYLEGTSLFDVFVDYFEKQGASHKEAIEQTENLSKAINSIWGLYLQRALPGEFDQQNIKALATGFSFGFMKWLVRNPQNIEEVNNYIAKLSNQNATQLIQSGLKGLMWSKNVIGFLQSSTTLVRELADNKDSLKPKSNKALKDPSVWADIVSWYLQNPQNYDPINELKKYICQQPFSEDCTKIDETHLKEIANETAKLLEQNPSMLKSMDYLANLTPMLREVDESIQQFKNNMLTNPVWWALINWLSDLQQMLSSLNKEWGSKLKGFLDNIMSWLGFRGWIESFWVEKARALQLSIKPSLITFLNQDKEEFKWTLFEQSNWKEVKGVKWNLTETSLDFFKNLKMSIPTTPKQQTNLIKQLFNSDEKKGRLTRLINQALTIDEFKQRFERRQFLLKLQNGRTILDLNELDKLLQAYIDFAKQKNRQGGIKTFDEFLLQMQTQYFIFGSTYKSPDNWKTNSSQNTTPRITVYTTSQPSQTPENTTGSPQNEQNPSSQKETPTGVQIEIIHPNKSPDDPIETTESKEDLLKSAAEFIKTQEGFLPTSQWDHKQRSRWYGTRAPGPNLTIDRQRAEKELTQHLETLLRQIEGFVNDQYWEKLNKNQKIALLSFAYNVGLGNFKEAFPFLAQPNTPFEEIKTKIPKIMEKYVYASGKKLQGLVNRRKREINLFNEPLS